MGEAVRHLPSPYCTMYCLTIQALEMEHRDLHTSNVLVKEAEEEYFLFVLDGEQFLVPSHGVKATIVDYTLSRVKQGVCVCVCIVPP